MACNNPTQPHPTPYERLADQYRVVTGVEPGDTEGLVIAFYLFRERLWSVIEVAMRLPMRYLKQRLTILVRPVRRPCRQKRRIWALEGNH